MELQKQNQSVSTNLQSKEIQMARSLFYVNLLSPFRVDDAIIEMWSVSLSRIDDRITPEEVQELMDAFMTGEIEYDNKIGIQNIFKGLEIKFASKYYKPKMVY